METTSSELKSISTNIQKEGKIHIYVSLHKDFYVADNKFFKPIQVGSALAEKRIEGVLHDDEGDNISEKNKSFCELTAQYWAWKNDFDADYYGFFHYRRYLSFNPVQLEHYNNIVEFEYCDDEAVQKLMLNEKIMENLISQYDAVYPKENFLEGGTVYEHWVQHLVKSDLDLLMTIIMEKYPDFYEYAVEVMNSNVSVHCNMFIMKKEIFNAYSKWLFDILFEHEKRANYSNYTTEQLRTVGHLAERLCAIYCKYLEANGAKICYLQRTMFKNNEKAKISEIKNIECFIPIVLACNNKYIKYTSVLIASIIQNSSPENNYCITILNTDISDENKCILKEQISETDNFSINFINVNRSMQSYKNLFVDRHLSVETYFRFLAPDCFPNLDKILYLDCDTIVNDDVAKLFSEDISHYSLAAAHDCDLLGLYLWDNEEDKEFHQNRDLDFGLEGCLNYFQAGVILFNLKKIRSKYTVKELLNIANSKKWFFQDQDVLNYVFKDDVKFIDASWNTLYEAFNRMEKISHAPNEYYQAYLKAKKSPKIIHYAGTPKPWQDINVDMGEYFWKYAKKSPVFELLLHELNGAYFIEDINRRSDIAKYNQLLDENNSLKWKLEEIMNNNKGEVVFECEYSPEQGHVGATLFKLTMDEFNYNNFYAEIDFVKLENKGVCTKDTLIISGTYHNESGKYEMYIHQTDWEKGSLAEWIYFYIIDNSVYFFGRYPGIHCGYYYTVKSLASRSTQETVKYEAVTNGFVNVNEKRSATAWCVEYKTEETKESQNIPTVKETVESSEDKKPEIIQIQTDND